MGESGTYIQVCVLMHLNTIGSVALEGLSPYKIIYGKKTPSLARIKYAPFDRISSTYRDYVQLLKSRLEQLGRTILELQEYNQKKQAQEQNKRVRSRKIWCKGMLVYLFTPSASSLSTNRKKIQMSFIGPLIIREMHCIL